MTHYANGAALERSVMAVLRDRGWVCTRSAGSHSPADVWAARAGWDPLLVQAKASGAISPAEWDDLWRAATAAGAVALVASRERCTDDRRRTRIRFRQLLGPRGDAARRPWEDWEVVG